MTMKRILIDAKKNNYAVPAPNVFSAETVEACFEAASTMRSPIIIDCAAIHDIEKIAHITDYYSRKYDQVRFALNLDHGSTFEEAILAIRNGFTSIMVDRSQLSIEDNIRETKELVKIAHSVGVSVESELGHVGIGLQYEETRDKGLTNPKEAIYFVSETGIDCLAVAIGTSHGTYKGTPRIDFGLLEELNESIHIPLVLHGGSGTGDENLEKCVKKGIQKINLFTDLSNCGLNNLNKYLYGEIIENGKLKDEFDIGSKNMYDAMQESKEGYMEKLKHYMMLFGSNNRI